METWITNRNKSGNTYTLKCSYGKNKNGEYIWKKFTAKTKSGAKRKKEEYDVKYCVASNSVMSKQFFGDYMHNWGEIYYKNSVKFSTYEGFLYTVSSRINNYPIGKTQLININLNRIQQHVNELVADRYSRATIIKTIRNIKQCVEYGMSNGDIQNIDLSKIIIPKEERVLKKKKDVTAFSLSDVDKISKEAIRTYSTGKLYYRYGYEILFLLHTGLRIGEALALTWSDVDFKKKVLNVTKTSSYVLDDSGDEFKKNKYQELICSPKTKNSIRRVYLNNAALNALYCIKERNSEYVTKTSRIFMSETGTPTCKRNISRCLSAITENCHTELQTSSVHVLRHTFATMYIIKGIPIAFISKQLGHAKESTTRDIYVSYLPEIFNEVVLT